MFTFSVISTVGLIMMASYLGCLSFKVRLASQYLRNQDTCFRNQSLSKQQARQITVAQPILSGDPLLEETLTQNLEQIHDSVSFIWLVDESDVEGLRIGGRLAAKYPQTQLEVCPLAPNDQNPKTFKLQRALQINRRRWFVVLDDDTLINDDALVAAINELDSAELYTGLPLYRNGRSRWGPLLAHFVNTNSILTYLPPLQFFPPLSINGMFYVVRAHELESIGGFLPILHELCDDYALKRHVTRFGWRIKQGVSFQYVTTHVASFHEYCRMMHRWMVFSVLLIRDQEWRQQILLVVLLALPPWILLLSLVLNVANIIGWVGILVGLGLRHLMIRRVQRRAGAQLICFSAWKSLFSELLQPFHSIGALLWPQITWRNRTIRVAKDLRFEISDRGDR